MKYQLNLPSKTVSKAHAVVSLCLVAVLLFLSFGSLFVIDVKGSEMGSQIQTALSSLSDDVPALKDIEIPDSIEVTSKKVIDSAILIVDFIRIMSSGLNSLGGEMSESEQKEAEDLAKSFEEKVSSKEGIDAIVMTVYLLTQLIDAEDFGGAEEGEEAEESDSGLADIALFIFKLIVLFSLLGFVAWTPISLVIALVIALILFIKSLTKKGSDKNGAKYINGMLVQVISICMLLSFMPGLAMGASLDTMFIISIIGVIINIAVTRLRAYGEGDFMFLNLVQGTSIVSAIGLSVFAVNFIGSGLINRCIATVTNFIASLFANVALINEGIRLHNSVAGSMGGTRVDMFSPDTIFILDIVLIFVFAAFTFGLIKKAVASLVSNLSLNLDSKKEGGNFLSLGIMSAISCVIPFVLVNLKNAKQYTLTDIEESGAVIEEKVLGSIFQMNAEEESALTGMVIGAVIMLVAGIAYVVLKKKVATKYNYTKENAGLLFAGKAPELAVADEAAVAEAPVAVEVPVQEAPVEEEAPAEVEAPVEEETPVQ